MPRYHLLTVLGRLYLALAVGLLSTLAGLGGGVSPAAAAPPTFATHVDFPTGTGSSPQSVAVADLNGDGKLDLVTANETGGNVSVLLNTTPPGAAAPTLADRFNFPLGTGTTPYSVAAADLNGDGKPDLVTANGGTHNVSVLLNATPPGAANPTFAAHVDFDTGNHPIAVAAADLNGDGKPDLAVTNGDSDTVSVLLNTTTSGVITPTFAARADFPTGTDSTPQSVAAADLNGDGRPDLAVGNKDGNTVSVLLNTTPPGAAAPTFAAHADFPTGSSPRSVAAADLNGDGVPDLATANSGSATVSVLFNTTAPGAAAPTFATRADFPTGTGSSPTLVAAVDLNGDGVPDLATANTGSDTVSVLLNTTLPGAAAPTFAAHADFGTGSAPISVVAADLNGDGKPDLATANEWGNTVSVLFNTIPMGAAPPTFAAQTGFATGTSPNSVVVADLNGDGVPDLAATAISGSNTISVLLNTTPPGAAAPAFAAHADFAAGPSPISVAAADLNGDGKLDLAVVNDSSNTVSVLLNTTPPGAAAPTFAALADFSTGNNPHSVAAADLNGDGKPDLVAANAISNTVSVLLNTTTPGAAAPTFAARADFAAGTYPESVATADLNGDGKPDLAVVNFSSNTVSVLLNTTPPGAAAPTFAARAGFTIGPGSFLRSVAAADLNGNGVPDLAVTNIGSATVSVLLNTTPPGAAAPTFATHADFTAGSLPYSVAAADLNGDGKPDLATANEDGSNVSVLLNTTPPGAAAPTFAARAYFTVGSHPFSVAAADLNGDGKLDLTAANYNNATISVLLNTTTAALPLAKTASPAVASPGQAITYTLAFTNPNLFTAAGVMLTDTLPVSVAGVGITSSVTITDTGAVPAYTWQVQDLAPGQGGIITITGVLSSPLKAGVFTNTATIAGTGVETGTASAPVTVQPVAPQAADDAFSVTEGSSGNVLAVLANDSDANGDSLSVQAVGAPAHGTATDNDADILYTPQADFFGTDVFTYTVSDGVLTDTASVTVTVNDVEETVYLPVILR